MHEIITISVSHRANHLATQFFNCQEASLYDNKNDSEKSIFLNPIVDRLSKTVSYYPRALLWDAKTGTGSLGKHQYFNEDDYYNFDDGDNNNVEKNESSDIMITHPRINRSEYQMALDSGSKLPVLTPSITRYWSDYSKLIYQPKSLNTLRNWYHDVEEPNLPDYENLGERKFNDYIIGYDEFNDNYSMDFFDDNFHYQLEQCDSLQGFQMITDLDSAWGGFSTALLLELRNELPKSVVYTWGLNEDDPLTGTVTKDQMITRANLHKLSNKLRASINLKQESDLFIPLYEPPNTSNWELSGMLCKIFDTVNSLFSQSNMDQRRSMDYLAECIKDGDEVRNIVSNITSTDCTDLQYSFYPRVKPLKTRRNDDSLHIFSKASITRTMEINHKSNDLKELFTYPYSPSDTIPIAFRKVSEFTVDLESTEVCRDVYQQWHDIVSKYFRHDSDREELKDELATVSSNYEFGWYDDEDSGDDDY
ncbi:hypothetical protein Kpol_1064p37 [Vanderwaltozyma polyspora DSM 70294]|uniref:Protein DML1 n=1 Tax=Vanderwaltozyma polyspora (strain ATCC 22028 / DSM 70294 / BCRC 21397 / CBS 2163 / NBRC 10782 / NRRL Y-8283 / UCD 57-17) TaxID=436907 RepID=A7TMG1_VANPO|nr:uncharacterized protein Kpol_1064p37 [Vanderwaltozyma polyspora DSM 70294]EDO16555.1 hypothetical protein Kpol_1064p37 [Vanderwaltozyma polyspora DSM 70294]